MAAKNCYKIITYDPMDDTIDEFGNLATGVVSQLAQNDYTTEQYKQFYKSILYVYNYERQLYNALS